MKRAYFLLVDSGPEIAAIEKRVAGQKDALKAWCDFAVKHGAKDKQYFHNNTSFAGLAFDTPPEGWCKISAKNPDIYRPRKRGNGEVYAEYKALPSIPHIGALGESFGECGILGGPSGRGFGMRMLFISYEIANTGQFILTCPIKGDGTFYVPKGKHEELTPGRYAELTKKED